MFLECSMEELGLFGGEDCWYGAIRAEKRKGTNNVFYLEYFPVLVCCFLAG